MTVFPQELHERVGGCMYNLTKTTEHTKYTQARVLGYYYRTPLTIGHRSLSGSPTLTGATCRYVRVERHHLYHARTREARYPGFSSLLSAFVEGAGQRTLAVPTSATTLYVHYSTCVDTMQQNEKLCEAVQRRFHPVQ